MNIKKYGKDILKLIIFLSIGIFFVWYSLKDLSDEQLNTVIVNIKDVLRDNRWIYLLLCMFIGFLSVVFRALRSVLMIEPLGHKVSNTNSYHATMIGYFANLAFPRLGEVLRCTILQRYEKVPFQKTLGTVITERIIDVIIFAIFFLITLQIESDKILSILSDSDAIKNVGNLFLGNGKYIVTGIIVGIIALIYILRKQIAQLSITKKIIKIIIGFWHGLISIKDLKHPFLFILYSLLIWLCFYLMFYICTFSFPDIMAFGTKDIMMASLTCVVIGTVGFVVAQGGLGAYPLLVSVVLLLYGVPEEMGLAIGWVIWTTESLMYSIFGLVSLLLLSFKKDKKQ
ncbi:MAG: flippase-like domain-containing protein [Bacteroidales bacterium]|jgi:uncharacterized protein (TIRG00374 family)|nr:flippase-like domain-containing protein [Bacteroidales bacterium]